MTVKCVRVFIEGRVQGVWFRGWTVQQATALGLDGWVRNRHDGRVEAVFCGSQERVNDMLGLCWQGPPLSRVTAVMETTENSHPDPGFNQQPSR